MKQNFKELTIEENLRFQKLFWVVQRIFWGLLFLFIISAIFGLFGNGLFSQKKVENAAAALSYEVFARDQSPTKLEIELHPSTSMSEKYFFALNYDFMKKIKIQRIEPQPERVINGMGSYVYEFMRDPDKSNLKLTIYYEPQTMGSLKGTLQTATGGKLEINQFIYP